MAAELREKFLRACNHASDKKYDEAMGLLLEIMSAPNADAGVLSRAYNLRGFLQKGHYHDRELALKDFDYAIELNPEHPFTYVNRALILFEDHTAALKDLNKAIELAPCLLDAYIRRGRLFEEMKKYHEAVKDYDMAITLAPSSASAITCKGRLLHEKLHRSSEALNCFTQAIRIQPTYHIAYQHRGRLHEDEYRRYEDALNDYNAAIMISPEDPISYNDRGVLYRDIFRDHPKALQDFFKAIELDPRFANPHAHIAYVHYLNNRMQEAEEFISKCISKNPKYSFGRFVQGLLLLHQGRNTEALDSFKRFVAGGCWNKGFIQEAEGHIKKLECQNSS